MAPVSIITPASKDAMHAAAGLRAEGEIYRRLHGLPPTSVGSEQRALVGQRVQITRLTARRHLNGAFGEAKSIDKGQVLVVLEHNGQGVRLHPSNLHLAAPAPAATVYNVGLGQYMLPSYSNNGLPRRCRTGSGTPSYSTRRVPEQDGSDVMPPEAGAILPKPNPPTAFRDARRGGHLPVRVGAAGVTLRWVDQDESEVDIEQESPLAALIGPTHCALRIEQGDSCWPKQFTV